LIGSKGFKRFVGLPFSGRHRLFRPARRYKNLIRRMASKTIFSSKAPWLQRWILVSP
jgi:hypothetical protein